MARTEDYKPVDFGNFKQDDIERVVRELGERNYGNLANISDEEVQGLTGIGRQFLMFLREAFKNLGLMDRSGVARTRIAVGCTAEAGDTPDDMLRKGWNERARDWAVIESPLNYALTIETLMEFMRTNSRRRRERFLSLGSGPGLYETFLGALFAQLPESRDIRIFAVDYAKEMTRIHERILRSIRLPNGRPLTSVRPITGDMTDLEFDDKSVDQIICNNALQWTTDWRKALAEMSRVMRPDGLGWLYLFVHTHPMSALREDGTTLFKLGDFEIPELLDALEANRFQIHRLRQIAGAKGTGQVGLPISRVFVLAKLDADGKITPWRECQVSAGMRGQQANGEWKTYR